MGRKKRHAFFAPLSNILRWQGSHGKKEEFVLPRKKPSRSNSPQNKQRGWKWENLLFNISVQYIWVLNLIFIREKKAIKLIEIAYIFIPTNSRSYWKCCQSDLLTLGQVSQSVHSSLSRIDPPKPSSPIPDRTKFTGTCYSKSKCRANIF